MARTIRGMLGSHPEVEDVGQTVFIKFYYSLQNFKGQSSLKTYLTRIAINESLNQIRKNKRYKKMQQRSNQEKDLNQNNDSDLNWEDMEKIRKALDSLDLKYKSILVLRYFNQSSMEEISQILNIPLGTVLSRLSRAQRKLKKWYAQKEVGVYG